MNHLTNAELLSLISAGRAAAAADELVALLAQRLEESEAAWAEEKAELLTEAEEDRQLAADELLAEEGARQEEEGRSAAFEAKADRLDLRLLTVYEKLKVGTAVPEVLAEMAGWDNGTWLEEPKNDHRT